MSVALLLLVFLLSCLHFFVKEESGWRLAVLKGYTFFGALIVISSELLSSIHNIQFVTVFTVWLLLALVLFYPLVQRWKKRQLQAPSLATLLQCIRHHIVLIIPYFPIAIIIMFAGFLAVKVPPNTWDSLSYRMTRIEYWIQHQSLDFYATHDQRQLYVPPFAELFILHLRVLSSSDVFASMPSWMSMVTALIGISVITHIIGGNRKQQYLAVLAAVTLPMGVFQSTSTQTDYIVAGWVVTFITFFLKYRATREQSWLLFMAISVGLACLTKPTAFFLALPFVIWLTVIELKHFSAKTFVHGLLFSLLFCAITFGHYMRSYSFYGTPLPHANDPVYTVEHITPVKLASNFLKNVVMQVSLPSKEVNTILTEVLLRIHKNILHINLNHPDTTWPSTHFELYDNWTESASGNPIQFVLLIVCIGLAVREKSVLLKVLTVALAFGALLLFVVLKWQPWITRLHLPALVVFSPIIGYYLARMPRVVIISTIFALFVQIFPALFYSYAKPILIEPSIFSLSRDEMLFIEKPHIKKGFDQLMDFLQDRRFASLGIYFYQTEWEYPILRALQERHIPYQSKHVSLWHQAASLEDLSYNPDAVIFLRSERQELTPEFERYISAYKKTKHFDYYSVYYRD